MRVSAIMVGVAAIAAMLCACKPSQVPADKGVSETLAQMRRDNISDVRYRLSVVVPDTVSLPVHGTCELQFDWVGHSDLPIDYAGQPDSTLVPVTVNGDEEKMLMVLDEHVVIPASMLREGPNAVSLPFESNDKTVNRHHDYLYTLFVPANARTAFPCFDQPDLKARFSLTLTVPQGWKAASNAPLREKDGDTYIFEETLPLPTYLFSYVAGQFDEKMGVRGDRQYTAYYREANPARDKQIEEVFDIIDFSIDWLENYTGIDYPFQKYDFVVLPGYQFGGMEHPGLVQYKDSRIFLGDNPTLDDLNDRFNLLSHETSHMWFGDMVTMRWFDDVWTKEVFANFMADKITAAKYPEVDFDLGFIGMHYATSYDVDRTLGTHAIQQPLDNLNNAGLMYDNIIYDKAPIMMQKMEEHMGADKLREALSCYLQKYKYGNATWDNLIAVLDSVAPEADIRQFDQAWVKEKGMPVVNVTWTGDSLTITQTDPEGRGLVWPQRLQVGAYSHDVGMRTFDVTMDAPTVTVACAGRPDAIIPNHDGLGYGRFVLDADFAYADYGLCPSQRMGLAMTIFENGKMGVLDTRSAMDLLLSMLRDEADPHVATSICKHLTSMAKAADIEEQKAIDELMLATADTHSMPMVRQMLLRSLIKTAQSPRVLERMLTLWQDASDPMLSTKDYMDGAMHLAVAYPDRWQEILDTQRRRLTSDDQVSEFDYVSRACNPDAEVRRALFESLIEPSNRINEPWALAAVRLLADKSRADQAAGYITPGLDALPYIQQTSDIFFPQNWANALLSTQTSEHAREQVRAWVDANKDMRPALLRKVLMAAEI